MPVKHTQRWIRRSASSISGWFDVLVRHSISAGLSSVILMESYHVYIIHYAAPVCCTSFILYYMVSWFSTGFFIFLSKKEILP